MEPAVDAIADARPSAVAHDSDKFDAIAAAGLRSHPATATVPNSQRRLDAQYGGARVNPATPVARPMGPKASRSFVPFDTELSASSKDAEAEALHSPPVPATTAYRPDIDGLRAVAVIAVIIYHLDKTWLPGGFTGVDMFFVISGFVVSSSLTRAQHHSTGSLLAAFYARRVRRLAPALFCCVLATAIAIALLVPPSGGANLQAYYTTGLAALLGMANNLFAMRGTGYEDEGPEGLELNPFTHMWSLGVEEQFYFLFPLVIAAAHGPRVVRLPPCPHALAARPLALLSGSAAASFIVSAYLSSSSPQLAFYLIPSRFWQLMSGAILFELHRRQPGAEGAPALKCAAGGAAAATSILLLLAVACCEIVILLLATAAFSLTPFDTAFPVPWSLPAIAAAALYIGLGSAVPRATRWPCGLPAPVLNACLGTGLPAYIGRLSYPLYLWHWPVIVFFKWTVGLRFSSSVAAAVAVSVVLALLTYHGVERLARHWRPRRIWHVFVALCLALASLSALLLLLGGPLHGRFYLFGVPKPPPPAARRFAPPPPPPPLVEALVFTRPSSTPLSPLLPPPAAAALPPPRPPPRPHCECANAAGAAHTAHTPPRASTDSSEMCLDPDAIFAADVADNDRWVQIHGESWANSRYPSGLDERFWIHSPCWVSDAWTEDTNRRCMTPARGDGNPERALFLVVRIYMCTYIYR